MTGNNNKPMVNFSRLDGSGRTPRNNQLQALQFLQENWEKADVFVLRLPTGAGKSFISRALMLAFMGEGGVGVLTPNNALVSQYLQDYPKVNTFVGVRHYLTTYAYDQAKLKALGGENTFYNVASYLSLTCDTNFIKPSVVILDEADQIIEHFQSASGWAIPVGLCAETLDGLVINLKKEVARLQALIKARPDTKAAQTTHKDKIEKYTKYLYQARELGSTDYTLSKEQDSNGVVTYSLRPVVMPTRYTRELFEGQKVIMLSGSIFPHDVESLIGKEAKVIYFDGESPIPVARRQVYVKPLSEEDYDTTFTYPVDYPKVALAIRDTVKKFHMLTPCMIHCTYSDMQAYRELFTEDEAVFHTPNTKTSAIQQWQAEPHKLFFGAGCTTGLDLKDDMCRLNIILKANFPNQMDIGVRKRTRMLDGRHWMELQVLRQLVQACGRSTRNEKDYSATIIFDTRLVGLIIANTAILPAYFREALDFYPLRGREKEINDALRHLT